MDEQEVELEALEQAVLPLMDGHGTPAAAGFEKYSELRDWLIGQVAMLIDRDFEHLLRVLYLIDVNERRVRLLIQENQGENVAAIIADLIMERQAEKIRSRRKYTPKDGKYFTEE